MNIKGAIKIEAWINPAVAQEKCWDGVSGNYGVISKVSAAISKDLYTLNLFNHL